MKLASPFDYFDCGLTLLKVNIILLCKVKSRNADCIRSLLCLVATKHAIS